MVDSLLTFSVSVARGFTLCGFGQHSPSPSIIAIHHKPHRSTLEYLQDIDLEDACLDLATGNQPTSGERHSAAPSDLEGSEAPLAKPLPRPYGLRRHGGVLFPPCTYGCLMLTCVWR